MKLVSEHQVTSWKEETIHDFQTTKITKTSATLSLKGDLEGTAVVEYSMYYKYINSENAHLSTAEYNGYLRFTGKLNKGASSEESHFVLEDIGNFADGIAKSKLKVIEGSGTKVFEGMLGEGFYSASKDGFHFELDVTLPSQDKNDNHDEHATKKHKTMTKADIAASFLKEVVSDATIDHAYDNYCAQEFVHHNPHFASDAQTLRDGMKGSNKMFPNTCLEIQRVIAEGNTVAVHSSVNMKPEAVAGSEEKLHFATVHIFQFDEENKVKELWDVAMKLPDPVVNEKGAF